MVNYTPWERIFSYDERADVTCVIEARGHGKTFGLREQFLRDWLKDGSRFCAIVRYENRIPLVARDYFGALSKPRPDGLPVSAIMRAHRFVFRRVGLALYVQEVPKSDWDNPDWKPKHGLWDTIGYFVSLSKFQDYKEMTFAKVRRLVLDEALIERPDGRHGYLDGEFERFTSVVWSVTRERPGESRKPNVYLLANACSSDNPYFGRYGVTEIPPNGFSWWGGKRFLLYVGDDQEYSQAVGEGTVAGRMAMGTGAQSVSVNNEFKRRDGGMLMSKPRDAELELALVIGGDTLSIWESASTGWVWIGTKIPKESGIETLCLLAEDNTVNYRMVERGGGAIRPLIDAYREGYVRFGTAHARFVFEDKVGRLYGLR